MDCNNGLSGGILHDCINTPVKGLDGSRAVIINYSDIDRLSSTVNGATITDLVVNGTGYVVEWYRELGSTSSTYNLNNDDYDGFGHTFSARFSVPSAEASERLSELKSGRFVVVVETNYKGADNKDAFKVYGWNSGLTLSTSDVNSNENSHSIVFSLSTSDGYVEQYGYNIFFEANDYATSKATFDTLYVNA